MADAGKENSEVKVDAAPAAGGGMNPKILFGVLGLNVVVMVGVIAVLFLAQKKKDADISVEQIAQGAAAGGEHGEKKGEGEKKGGEHGEKKEGGEHGGKGEGGEHGGKGEGEGGGNTSGPRYFSVGDFTSNLSGPASTHYVKVNVNFELSKDADEEELKKRRPQIRDKVISLLNSKKPVDLQNVEGQNFLKEEIKTAVNGVLQAGKVEGVYFSTFIVN